MINLDGDTLTVTGQLDLDTLMGYREAVEQSVPAGGSMLVDLEQVTFEGSAILALLVFMRRRSRSAGGELSFRNASPRLVEMASLAGVVDLLGLGD